MSSYLLAIWANRDTGEPYSGRGRIGHVVRVGLNADMPVVLEFTDGGRFPHEDCAPASMQSRFLEGHLGTSVQEIESIAGTGLNGTGFPGCLAALQHWGVEATFSRGSPPPGYIMNPMIGTIQPVSAFEGYLNNSQGGCIVMADPAPVVYPPPPPPPTLEDDVTLVAVRSPGSVDPLGPGAVYLVKDPVYGPKRHITADGDFAGYLRACRQTEPAIIDAYVLDRMELGPEIDNSVTSPPVP